MKYVMFECKSPGKVTLHVPVLFPEALVHKDVAEMIENVKVQPEGPFSRWWMWPKPVSAGFINEDGVVHGYSESLNLKSHPDDMHIIKSYNGPMPGGIGFAERENG